MKSMLINQMLYHNAESSKKILKHDFIHLKKRYSLATSDHVSNLETDIKQKQNLIEALKRENKEIQRLQQFTKESPRERLMKSDIHDFIHYQKLITDSEKKTSDLKEKFKELQLRHANLLAEYQENRIPETRNEDNSRKEHQELTRKLAIISKASNSQSEKLRNLIKKLQGELKEIEGKTLMLNAMISKKNQNAMIMNYQREEIEAGCFDMKGKDWKPSVDFIYKPSLNKIYN